MDNEGNTLARQRVYALLDSNSFVEIGAQVLARNTDYNMSSEKVPSDGVITGYGQMNGHLVFIYSQNPDVLRGTLGEMHCKKIASLYQSAIKMGAPVIGILDSAGFRLQESTDALEGFGGILEVMNQASGMIPCFCVVAGNCGGGLSLIPALSDFSFMLEKEGRLFVNSPNTIPENYEEKSDPSKGKYQEMYSGIIDFCGSYKEICAKIMDLLELLPSSLRESNLAADCEDDFNRSCEGIVQGAFDLDYFLRELSDNHFYVETKPVFAPDFFTGFIRLGGLTVGVLGNRTVIRRGDSKKTAEARLTADGLSKGADFIQYCDSFHLPILSITDVVGFETSERSERVLAREMGRFSNALIRAGVAKVNLIPRQAYGTGYVLMNGKATGADLVYAWENAQIGSMEAEKAEKILSGTLNTDVSQAAARGYVDMILQPEQSRKYLISAFDLLYTKNNGVPAKKHTTK